MADTPEEHLTEELLDRLLHSAKIETYLDEEHITDRALPDYLNELLDRSGIKRNPLAEKTGMNQTFIYDIFAGKSRPGKEQRHQTRVRARVRPARDPAAAAACRRERALLQAAARRNHHLVHSELAGTFPLPTMNCIGWARIPWCRRTSAGR